MSYNIVVKHYLKTQKRGQVVDTVDKLTDARKKVLEWEDYLLVNSGPDWTVSFRIVR